MGLFAHRLKALSLTGVSFSVELPAVAGGGLQVRYRGKHPKGEQDTFKGHNTAFKEKNMFILLVWDKNGESKKKKKSQYGGAFLYPKHWEC